MTSPKRLIVIPIIACAAIANLGGQARPAGPAQENTAGYQELDDFSGERSSLGTAWEGFSDRVMGGVSELRSQVLTEEAHRYLRISGTVSTRNNGGFIQVRLVLGSDFSPFDGSRYRGVRVVVRGTGDAYFLHLRTAGMMLPWKYYAAPVGVTAAWTAVDIPWSAFEKGDFGTMGKLNPSRLKSIAVVAAKKDFDALIDVREIGFY